MASICGHTPRATAAWADFTGDWRCSLAGVLVGGFFWDTGARRNAVRAAVRELESGRTFVVAWSRLPQGAAPRLHRAAALGRHRQQQTAAP
jgi:hypothetical protein